MAYKYAKGKVYRGDIYSEDDTQKNTYLDWEEDYLGVVTAGTSILVVSGSKVGIGTTAPTANFHISSSATDDTVLFRVDGGDSTENPIIYVVSSGSGEGIWGSPAIGFGTATPEYTFDLVEASNAYEMRVKSTQGHVSLNLDAASGADPRLYFQIDGDDKLLLKVDNSTGDLLFITPESDPVAKRVLRIQQNDRVGVGLQYSTAAATLHISSSVGDGTDLFRVDGDTRFTITEDGEVGIGTTSPTISLDVHYTGAGSPINLDDDEGGGEVVYFGTGSLSTGALHYLNEDGGWAETSAEVTGSGHDQLLGIPLGTDPAADGVLIKGYFHVDTYLSGTFKKGKPVYVCSSSSGQDGFMSGAAPTAADSYVRVVGYGTDVGNVIYFNPDATYIELA